MESEKEEKQRQNEEISNNMTESWEFISPNESESAVGGNTNKPCFIDASTLLDDHEVCLDAPILPQGGCFGPKPIRDQFSKEDSVCDELMIFQCDDQQAASSCSSLSLQRQEQERRKGQQIFDNSINQFSGHKINLNEDNVTQNYFDSIRPATVTCEERMGLYTPFNSIIQLDYIHHCPSFQEEADTDFDKASTSRAELLSRKSLDESIPIISGGSSIEDHFIRPNAGSPLVKRKTDNCPIVSGGSTIMPLAENESPVKSRLSSSSSSNTSWTISFHKNEPGAKPKVAVPTTMSVDSAKNNCGFFVDFGDKKTGPNSIDKLVVTKPTTNDDSLRKSTGFFVDLSTDAKVQINPDKNQITEVIEPQEKKNIFSMFVDISGQASDALTSSFSKKKPSIEAIDPPHVFLVEKNTKVTDEDRDSLVKLRTAEMSALHRNFELAAKQRHSWNELDQKDDEKPNYKRSVSVSSENVEPASLNLDSKLMSSKTSSMNIDSSIPSPLEDFSSKSLSSNYSNNSATNSNSSNGSELKDKQRRRRKDVNINETFDKSSAGSITDGILSSQDSSSSPISTTTEDTCCPDNLENSVAERSSCNSLKNLKKNEPVGQRSKNQIEAIKEQQDITKEAMATLQKTIEKQKQLLETVNENIDETQNKAFYVKLSDMDKPILDAHDQSTFISEMFSNSMSSALRSGRHRGSSAGGSTSKNRQSWNMMTCSTGTGHIPASVNNLALSFENSKSLSRLFPHLSKAFSNSVPTNMELTSTNAINSATTNNIAFNNSHFTNQSNIMCDCIESVDFSCTSSTSCTSSRSNIEDSADDSSIGNRQRLGEDLLKMFLQEIATDVTIEVGGRKMRAHKCILRSRCQYFAAILAGNWLNNSGNIISLPMEYSFATVHFALCHIYSGASHPPEGISLMELASLSDLLGLEGLKEVTAYSLKINYCHNFHKPCSGCIDGICLVLPAALNHGLDELYRKCLRWVCKYYIKVWSTRAFSQLPKELINRCRQQIVAHMSSESVINIILDCEQLLSILAPCRWATTVENIIREIFDACINYISEHFSNLIASDSFLSLGHGHGNSWTLSHIENILLRTASTLTPDQACKSYPRANRLNKLLQAKVITMPLTNNDDTDEMKINNLNSHQEEEMDWSDEFTRLVSAILSAVEQCLIRQCARAMRVASWQRMDVELRNKIQKLACLTEAAQNLSTEKLSSRNSISKHNYASSAPSQSRQNDLQQVRLTMLQQQNGKFYQTTSLLSNQHTNKRVGQHQTNSETMRYNNFDLKNTSANRPLSKTASKANVPTTLALMNAKNDNLKMTMTKKLTNEDKFQGKANISDKGSNSSISLPAKIKSRYLDPPIRNAKTQVTDKKTNVIAVASQKTSSTILNTNSSTGPRKNIQAPNNKIENDAKMRNLSLLTAKEGSNLSLDSLSSTTDSRYKKKMNLMKVAPRMPSNDKLDISVDSLSISVKSSSKCSQESLLHSNSDRRRLSNTSSATSTKTKNKENLEKLIKPTKASAEREKLNKMNLMLVRNRNRTSTNVATTSDSSPSSIVLSTRSSTGGQSVRRSVSKPASENGKKSFLSQKSREILAKREQKLLEVASEPVSAPVPRKIKSKNATTLIPKSKVLNQSGSQKKAKETKTWNEQTDQISSKLERSSTFCKECPDNPDLLEISDGLEQSIAN